MNLKFLGTICAVCVWSLVAKAEILMYDGFPIGDGAYKANASGTANINKSNQPASQFTTDLIFGFDPNQWTESTSVIYGLSTSAHPPLALPASFSGLPSAKYVGEGSIGGSGNGSNDERSQSKKLSSAVQTALSSAQEFHFRCLVKINQASLNNLQNDSDDLNVPNLAAYGAGLTSVSGDGSFRNRSGSVSRILCFAMRRAGKDDNRLSLLVKGSDESLGVAQVHVYDLLPSISGGVTYLCYAKVVVDPNGKEKIYAFAQDVASYDPGIAVPLVAEAELVDATSSLSYITCDLARYSAAFQADEFALATSADDIMVLGKEGETALDSDCTAIFANGICTVSGTVRKGAATEAGATADDGETVVKLPQEGAVAIGTKVEKSFGLDELVANKTYRVGIYAKNEVNEAQYDLATAYSGVLTLTKLADANEYRLVPGRVQVLRAAADPFDLVVNYAFTSDKGTPGATWLAPEGKVTIPAGETSAVITLQPLSDDAVTEDITVSIALTEGNYLPGAAAVPVLLKNIALPQGYNIWVAEADGKASDATNWNLKHVPTAEEAILIDGDISAANMEWDAGVNGLPSTVKSWTMHNGVETPAGTVTIPTVYPGSEASGFTVLTVTGDMLVDGGVLTQAENAPASEAYRLCLSIGGDFKVGAQGVIDVSAKGPKGLMTGRSPGVYGGDGGATLGKTYGDPKRPYECGSGNQYNKISFGGGGAVWVEVGGSATIDGVIKSNNETWNSSAVQQLAGGNGRSSSGGAVYLEAAEVKGAGTISVAALSNGGDSGGGASGGRLAIWSKTKPCALDPKNLKAHGFAGNSNNGGAGTVVIRNPSEANGTLYVRNYSARQFTAANRAPTAMQTTTIPSGQTWTFDALVFGDYGILTLTEGAALNLPNGFASVSSLTSDEVSSAFRRRQTGLIVRGGTLTAPAVDGVHTFCGDWTFHPAVPFVLTADTTVTAGSNLGMMSFCRDKETIDACELKVTGNLTVSATGTLNVEAAGLGGDPDCGASNFLAWPAGSSVWGMGHGGQNGQYASNVSCGSFFEPTLVGVAGGSVTDRNIGGGAMKLEVTGRLTLDGKASASTAFPFQNTNGSWGSRPASPGSLQMTVGSLTGSGTIAADGALGRQSVNDNGYGPTGGGRIAVRLTDEGASFSDDWISRITAKGATLANANPTNSASAGSVYLQTQAQGEKKGSIVIGNDGVVGNLAYTPIPSAALGEAASAFKEAALGLRDCANVRLYASLTMRELAFAAQTKLDLNGHTFSVKKATIGGTKLSTGTYTKDSADVSGYVTGDGSLVVTGGGLVLFLR